MLGYLSAILLNFLFVKFLITKSLLLFSELKIQTQNPAT